eukprot:6202985-Pleurochrysis_carterae.AAC.1
MPSGRKKGRENSNSTRRDDGTLWVLRSGRGAGSAASETSVRIVGIPGGCVGSPSERCAIASLGLALSRHGNDSSSKYASEVTTNRFALGTQMLYAPGESTFSPKMMPSQARASILLLE